MARTRSCSSALARQCHVSSAHALASLGLLCSTASDVLRGPWTLSRLQGLLGRTSFSPRDRGSWDLGQSARSRGIAESSSPRAAAAAAEAGAGGQGQGVPVGPWLIVGLGNPGPKYEGTRHNVGFEVVDALAAQEGIPMGSVQCRALVGKGRVCGVPVVLAKPQTFMNVSGDSVGPLAKFYKIPPVQVLVVYDDLDIDVASMKLLAKGGHGGHNGMRSIVDRFGGDKNFPRLRFGIGRPPGKMPTASFVLHKFTKDEREEVDIAISRSVDGIRLVLSQGLDKAVSQWNQPKKQPARAV